MQRRSSLMKDAYSRKSESVFVYAVLGLDKVKIGRTKRLSVRLCDLRIGSPAPLKLIGKIELPTDHHAMKVEKTLHKELKEFKSHGEWFHNPEAVMKAFRKAKEIIESLHVPIRVADGGRQDACDVVSAITGLRERG